MWRFLCGICFAMLFCGPDSYATTIEVNNPFPSVSVIIDVKCDWDYRTKKYAFKKTVVLKRSDKVVLNVPPNLRRCEIWPIDFKLFRDIKEKQ